MKDEIITIIDHAGKVLEICINKKLGVIDHYTRERLLVAIHDLKTVPGLIIQLQTGKKTGRHSGGKFKIKKRTVQTGLKPVSTTYKKHEKTSREKLS